MEPLHVMRRTDKHAINSSCNTPIKLHTGYIQEYDRFKVFMKEIQQKTTLSLSLMIMK